MAGRTSLVRAEPGFTLPFFERLAPPPPPALVAARIETLAKPGDTVLDLAGRGGWVARAAVDRQRRAVTLESSPLTRLLAELVLRPPDLRHLDAAFQAMGASPRGQTSLKVAVGDLFATRCATCGRALVLDEIVWPSQDARTGSDDGPADPTATGPDGGPAPDARKVYACPVCRGPRGSDQRTAPLDDADLARASAVPGDLRAVRGRLRERFPVVEGGVGLVDGLLDLHTSRQLVGLEAILDRIESDLRAAPVEAALRLAFLHALLPASRLNGHPHRVGSLRIQAGHVRAPSTGPWRERNPWLAFEDGIRIVRGFIQRLESGPGGAVQARLGNDLQALDEGAATAVVAVAGPTTTRAIGEEALRPAGWDGSTTLRRRVRLVIGQPAVRPNQERLSMTYWATAWTLGSEAAAGLPLGALSGPPIRAPWGWQSAGLARSLASVEPSIARDGRVAFIVDGGREALLSAALGGVQAGFRLLSARLGDGDDEATGTVELLPPGAAPPPAPRTRANVALDPAPGGAGDPDMVPGIGLFSAAERVDRRPFSAAEVSRTVVEVAVESLKARGEAASGERLLGDILVGLDRAGQLRRLVADRGLAVRRDEEGEAPGRASDRDPRGDDAMPATDGVRAADDRPAHPEGSPADEGRSADAAPGGGAADGGSADGPIVDGPNEDGRSHGGRPRERTAAARPEIRIQTRRSIRAADAPPDPVEALLALIGDGLAHTGRSRLEEIAPGRWWLADRRDREAAAVPLSDRVEWAVYSLLSTAGPLSEAAFLQRIAGLFQGADLPDEALVRACLQSYRSRASTSERIVTGDDLLRSAQEHAELIALLTETGHRLGFRVWIGRREQVRRLGRGRLADLLDEREVQAPLANISSRAAEDVAEVDCAWYVRGKAAFLFEVEWTAMLGEPILRRHGRIPQDESTVRFLVVAPERTELVRHKIERSPLLRDAFERDNWHVLKWNHLRAFAARDEVTLDALEPYLGLDPVVERSGEQLGLFGA